MATMFIHSRCHVRNLFAIIIIFSVLLTGVTPVGAVATDETTTPGSSVETPLSSDATPQTEIPNTTRTLNQSTVEPGGAVRVTVTTELNSTGDPALYEQLGTGPSNISITAIEPAAVVDAVTNSSDEVAVIWESTNSTAAEYVIDISETASTGSQINISGVVETQNETLPIENNTVSIEDTSNGPVERALQITGKDDPAELTQSDVSNTITLFNRNEQVNGINITQRDVSNVITLFERN